jgi:hypothetical protein
MSKNFMQIGFSKSFLKERNQKNQVYNLLFMKVSDRYYRKKMYNYIIKVLFVYINILIYLGENVIINIKNLNSSRKGMFFQRLMVKRNQIRKDCYATIFSGV